MKKFFALIILISVLLVIFTDFSSNQNCQKKPIYAKLPLKEDQGENYNFIVAGHIYGSHQKAQQGRLSPSENIIKNLEYIKSLNPKFFVSLGDSYFLPQDKYIKPFINQVIKQLKIPFIIAPGNHELGRDWQNYCQNFGKFYYDFTYKSSMFLIINTGHEDSAKIDAKQLKFIKNSIQEFNKNNNLKRLFIFSHKYIFAIEDKDMNKIAKYRFNGQYYDQYQNINYQQKLQPILEATKKPIYFFAGDLKENSTFYHQKDNITFIATHIYDQANDQVIQVNINKGKVIINAIDLTK